jgi:hypothetical protein
MVMRDDGGSCLRSSAKSLMSYTDNFTGYYRVR